MLLVIKVSAQANYKRSSEKTYPIRNFHVSKLNCLLPTRAHNYCMSNVCGMQCTSYFIGYLHYNIKAGCRGGRSKGFYTFQLKVYSCVQPDTAPDGCQQKLLTNFTE